MESLTKLCAKNVTENKLIPDQCLEQIVDACCVYLPFQPYSRTTYLNVSEKAYKFVGSVYSSLQNAMNANPNEKSGGIIYLKQHISPMFSTKIVYVYLGKKSHFKVVTNDRNYFEQCIKLIIRGNIVIENYMYIVDSDKEFIPEIDDDPFNTKPNKETLNSS